MLEILQSPPPRRTSGRKVLCLPPGSFGKEPARKLRRLRALGLGWIVLLAGACARPAEGFLGPFPVRTQHPVELTVLDLSQRRGRVLPPARGEIRLQAVEANQALTSHGGPRDEDFRFDLETTRVSLPLRLGLGYGMDIETTPAFLRPTPGFLDGFIENFHRDLGFPNGERSDLGRYHYQAYIQKGGDRVFDLKGGEVLLEDLPAILSAQVLKEKGNLPDLVFRLALEAPLGKSRKGAGNGGWDEGLGMALSKEVLGMEVSGTLSWVHPHSPRRFRKKGVRLGNRWSSGWALEIPLSRKLSAIAQFRYHQSVLDNMNARRLNKPQLLVWTGGRYLVSRSFFLEASIGEDLIQKVSPDVSFHLGMGARF